MKYIVVGIFFAVALLGDIYSQGQKNFGISISAGSGYGSNYTIVGVSANYFVIDNLLAGLEYRGWFGGEPSINELSVPLTYVIPIEAKIRPYLGGFYRRTFLGSAHGIDFEDYNVYGGRIGVSMINGSHGYATIGWVQEYYDTDQDDTSNGYPEIAVGLSF